MAAWYRFERHGRAEVTVFDFDGVRARTGAKGTRFFREQLSQGRGDLQGLVRDALRWMPEVRRRWPRRNWPQPAGLMSDEEEIVLPALLLAAGHGSEEVDRIVRSGGRGW